MTMETMDVVGSTVSTPFGVSGFVDNLFFLRFVESAGHIRRLLSITKMRDADHHPGLHVMEIGPGGIDIGGVYSMDGDIIPRGRPVDR